MTRPSRGFGCGVVVSSDQAVYFVVENSVNPVATKMSGVLPATLCMDEKLLFQATRRRMDKGLSKCGVGLSYELRHAFKHEKNPRDPVSSSTQ